MKSFSSPVSPVPLVPYLSCFPCLLSLLSPVSPVFFCPVSPVFLSLSLPCPPLMSPLSPVSPVCPPCGSERVETAAVQVRWRRDKRCVVASFGQTSANFSSSECGVAHRDLSRGSLAITTSWSKHTITPRPTLDHYCTSILGQWDTATSVTIGVKS